MLLKPIYLAAALWISFIVNAWLLILRQVPSDFISWGFLFLFLVLAILTSAIISKRP